MSLHCPARLFVARHGDAEYSVAARVMSDEGGHLSPRGRGQVEALADSLRDEHLAAVASSTLSRAVESAEVAARRLDLTHSALAGLDEIGVGDCAGRPYGDSCYLGPYDRWAAGDLDARICGGEDGHEVLDRFRDAVEELADTHRGESVLVFTHGSIMALAVLALADSVPRGARSARYLPNAQPALIEADADGLRLLSWPGAVDQGVV